MTITITHRPEADRDPATPAASGPSVGARPASSARADRRRPDRPVPAPPPRWARRAAVVAALLPVPSGLWRMAMAVGVPVGASDEILRERYGFPGWGTAYVFGLTFLLVGLGLLTLGLVQRWGEVAPRWLPFVGGRAVHPLAAVVPAGTGSVALTLMWVSVFSSVGTIWTYYGLDGAERVLMMACYLPLLLWGPLLAAVTVSYHRRHRRVEGLPAQRV